MNDLKDISIDNEIFHFEYFLGGDWKFLACVCGINSANDNYACIWCKCAHLDRCDTTKHWSILDPDKGARTVDETEKHARSKKFNCKCRPIFHFIPISHVVVDTLHLFLIVSDNLIRHLIRELRRVIQLIRKSNSLMVSAEKSIGI